MTKAPYTREGLTGRRVPQGQESAKARKRGRKMWGCCYRREEYGQNAAYIKILTLGYNNPSINNLMIGYNKELKALSCDLDKSKVR